MTPQEIFNKVVTHLFDQGGKSEHGGLCRYRDPYGNSCAVGCLIPDEIYDPGIEGAGLRGLTERRFHSERQLKLVKVLERSGIAEPTLRKLLERLQSVHDNCGTNLEGGFDLTNLKERLQEVARSTQPGDA